MTKKFFYLYILVLFVHSQLIFAQSNSGDFPYITETPGELIVRLHPDASGEHLERLSRRLGAVSVFPVFPATTAGGRHPRLRRIYLIRFPKGWQLDTLRRRYERHGAIEAVEMNRLNQFCAETPPNDPSYVEQWNLDVLNMRQAWNIEQGKPHVTVAVVDSGIATQHPELRSRIWENVGEIPRNGIDDDGNGYVDDKNGWDFSDAPTLPGSGDWTVRDNDPEDETGHGTHVSGIIAAEANNGHGIAGIAPNCRLMPLRAGFKYGGGAYLQNDDLAAAIVYAADNGAGVINMSWGDTVRAFIIEDAVEYAHHRGCVLVGAAGNSATIGSYYPAALKSVISVAGLGQEKQLYDGSNFGATINIAAPGEEILSTALKGEYGKRDGTSMAAAHVSGVAALVLSANPNATNIRIQEKLIATAKPLFITELVGAGALDAYAALTETSTPLVAEINAQRTLQHAFGGEQSHGGVEIVGAEIARDVIFDRIEIIGSAGGAEFSEYWLEYGIGEVPELWYPLGTVQTEPKFRACLHKWDTSTLAEGGYTLRLSVKSENGDIKRVKAVVDVAHEVPLVIKHEAQPWLAGNRFNSVVMWETEALTTGKIQMLEANRNINRTGHSDAENLLHFVNMSDLGVPPGTYVYRLAVKSSVGELHIDDNNGRLYQLGVDDTSIDISHLRQVASIDSGLHAIASPVDINRNGKLELFAVEMGTGAAHVLEIADDGTDEQIFSFPESLWPWAAADTDNDGLIEVLCNASGATFLLEQPAQGELPTERIWEARGQWSRTIADADADGTPEIFARDDVTNTISVYEAVENNDYRIVATLENPMWGNTGISANFATGDFDGDGRTEILAGDNGGRVFIHEATGNDEYRQTWIHTLPEGIPQLFATGDMDGDGNAEFAICAKTGTQVGTTQLDIRYHHWLLTVFKSEGDDIYRAVWTQRIRDVRDGGNGMTISDINNDGRNELCIAVQPNFYLVQYDGIDYRPIWHHPSTSTFNPIVVDLNGDGVKALLFNSNNDLTVFETSETVTPSPPSTSVSVAPTQRPRLHTAVHSPPNQLLLEFDKPMGISATNAGRYRLHKQGNSENGSQRYTPRSAILDKAGKRVVLTFSPEVFRTGNHYQIEALQLSDIYGADLAEDARMLTIMLPAPMLAEVIVYPNPVITCNQVTFDKLPAGTDVYIYDVSGNCIASLTRTEYERDRRVWELFGVSSGVYIYVLSSEKDQRIGKFSVIR
ncbi:MAG: S8 family serine peptidase [Candidatus Poribacteria bacterium]|nr:S8 family serine peptidase [Candidatus Poribacteria bacterium]